MAVGEGQSRRLSFGYLATKTSQRSDDTRELLELDLYEISVTPAPANNRTRVLSTKDQ